MLEVGWAAEGAGDYAAAREAYEESLAIARELGYKRLIARALTQLGDTDTLEGRTRDARERYEETLPIWSEIGHKSGLVDALRGAGDVARLDGDHTRAEELLMQSLDMCRDIGARDREARALQSLGALRLDQKEPSEASSRYRDALDLWTEMDHVHGIAICLRGLGEAAALDGAFDRVARLLGASETLMQRVGSRVPPCDIEALNRSAEAARRGLGPARYEAAFGEGRALTLEQAVELAQT